MCVSKSLRTQSSVRNKVCTYAYMCAQTSPAETISVLFRECHDIMSYLPDGIRCMYVQVCTLAQCRTGHREAKPSPLEQSMTKALTEMNCAL